MKGKKHSAAAKLKISLARRKAELNKRLTARRTAKAPLPLVTMPQPPVPSSISSAIVFGYRCREKGMSLEEAMDEAFKLVLGQIQSRDADE